MTEATCGCHYARNHPSEHDFMLGIEDMDPIKAVTYVAGCISDEDLGGLIDYSAEEAAATTRNMLDDPDEIRSFVGRHNWRNPDAVYQMAVAVSEATQQAWDGRRADTPQE